MISFTTVLGVKSGITYVISHNYAKIKVDSYDSLSLEKTMTFHNVVIHTIPFGIKTKITTTAIHS